MDQRHIIIASSFFLLSDRLTVQHLNQRYQLVQVFFFLWVLSVWTWYSWNAQRDGITSSVLHHGVMNASSRPTGSCPARWHFGAGILHRAFSDLKITPLILAAISACATTSDGIRSTLPFCSLPPLERTAASLAVVFSVCLTESLESWKKRLIRI